MKHVEPEIVPNKLNVLLLYGTHDANTEQYELGTREETASILPRSGYQSFFG